MIDMKYMNATVGVVRYVGDDGVTLIECSDPFTTTSVPMILDKTQAMIASVYIDQWVCVHSGKVYPLIGKVA
jgi:hypothetical protein